MTTCAVVTGVAGFIGSSLAEQLVADGVQVVGVDCFTGYYDEAMKHSNISALLGSPRFSLVRADLRSVELEPILEGADVVFHQAGQPGVRSSWSDGFADYVSHNVLATQRLLEAAVAVGIPRVVNASSSSVYGNAVRHPVDECDLPQPHSPYGVTKLAAEHLATLYGGNWGLSTVSLRYFTVYGPRQRPDMAMHRLFEAANSGRPFPLFGDGSVVRDFTYVGDAVRANLAAAVADVAPGTVVNVAGGSQTSMRSLIELVGTITGVEVPVDRRPAQLGDVQRTGGSIERARSLLGWEPVVSLRDGLDAQACWHRSRHRNAA